VSIIHGSVESALPTYPLPPTPTIPYVTFITTDKNPQVVYSTGPKPGYSRSYSNDGAVLDPVANPGHHITAEPSDPHQSNPLGPPAHAPTTRTQVIITAEPDKVQIGTKTVTNLRPGQTTTVHVGGATFTIGPTAVIGDGQTLIKPAPSPQIRTTMHGLLFSASGSVVVVDGTTMIVPEEGLSIVINHEPVSISPGVAIFGNDFISWPAKDNKDGLAVAGGERVTAIGPTVFVINSTTISYGTDTAQTTTLDDDILTIGPDGVTLESTTLAPTSGETLYAFIGGVTVSRSDNVIFINGKTFSVDEADVTTTMGGEVLTVGRDGVRMSGVTIGGKRSTGSDGMDKVFATFEGESRPEETGNSKDDNDEDDGAGALSPHRISAGITGLAVLGLLI